MIEIFRRHHSANPMAIRYDRMTIILHWLTAFLVLEQFVTAQTWDFFEKASPYRRDLVLTHLAGAIMLTVTVGVRIVWRVSRRHAIPAAVTGLQHFAAKALHTLLYILLTGQVTLGLLFSWSTGKPLPFFDLFSVPVPITIDADLRPTLAHLHNYVGWGIIGAVTLHAGAALFHYYVLRDEVLARMLLVRQRLIR